MENMKLTLTHTHDWEDPDFIAKFELAKKTFDDDERIELYRELHIDALEAAVWLLLPMGYDILYWQPWLKGLRGAKNYYLANWYKYWWLDLDLKESITGAR